jgi:hypothetical protein
MEKLGFFSAQEVLNNGGTKLMMEIKNNLKKNSQTSILSTKTLSDVQRQAFLDANFDL